MSEFDRYHVSVGTGRQPPIIVGRDDPRIAIFSEGLEPGRTYPVLVKTLSGNVASWPATANITTRPLAVQNLTAAVPSAGTEGITSATDLILSWSPDGRSQQDAFKIAYQVRLDDLGFIHSIKSKFYFRRKSYPAIPTRIPGTWAEF